MTTVDESYRLCAAAARRAASSFYWTFWLLPKKKRRAMCALYAFSRHTDDLADNNREPVEVRRRRLRLWRNQLAEALQDRCDHTLLPAVADTLRQFSAPPKYLFDIITGVEMDLQPVRYDTFEELSEYCYHVASAVGLACIHIWGFRNGRAFEPAIQCGVAFQLTNILRDLKEDADRGRIYLPREDMERFNYSPEDLRRGVRNERWQDLMRFEIERAERLYEAAAPLAEDLFRDGRRIFKMMTATYRRLLAEIKRRDGDVFTERIRLRWPAKAGIAAGLFL